MESARQATIVSVLVLTFVAGCIGDSGNQASREEPSPPFPPEAAAPLSLRQCQVRGGAFPIPIDFMAGSLPPGFEPIPADELGLTSHVTVYGIQCEVTQGDEQSTSFLIGWWPVDPPDQLERPEVTRYLMTDGAYVQAGTALEWFRTLPFNHSLAAAEVTFESTAFADAGTGTTTGEDSAGAISIAWAYAGPRSPAGDEVWDLFVVGPGIPMELHGVIEVEISASSAIGPGEATMEARAAGLFPAAQHSAGFARGLDGVAIDLACNPGCHLGAVQ